MSSEKRILIDRLDNLSRQIAKVRYPDCVCCHYAATDTVHIFVRKSHSVRWEPDNILRMCDSCHRNFAHKHPSRFMDWAQRFLGEERFDRLNRKAHNPEKWSVSTLREIEHKLILEASEKGRIF